MSANVGTAGAASSCLGSARNCFWGVNTSLWWAFALTTTTTLAAFSSPDGVTWTARATHVLTMLSAAEGRDLMLAYKNIGGLDVVWFVEINNAATAGTNAVDVVRATISGTTVTYHTTDVGIGTTSTTMTAPTYSSGGCELDSNNRLYVTNGALDTNQDTSWTRSTADPGTAEQATAPTWAAVATIDTTQASVVKSGYLFPTATAGNMALIADNGTAASTWTGLSFYTYNGTSWSGTGGNTSVTGAVTAVDKNAWGAVARTTTDVHVVYRSSTGSWVHRRWNGTSWAAGQSIPAFATASGTGTALATDGTDVWLFAIGSDAANSVQYVKWSSGSSTWGTWTTLEGTTATRTFISCSRDAGNGQILVLWHEGTTLVAGVLSVAAAAAPPPVPLLYARQATGRAALW